MQYHQEGDTGRCGWRRLWSARLGSVRHREGPRHHEGNVGRSRVRRGGQAGGKGAERAY